MELIVATKNKKKFQEIRELLKDTDLKVTSLLDHPEKVRIVENGKTFKQNAVKKAVKIASAFKTLTLGEDSGICIDALGGKPGVYSSRFSGKNKSDAANNAKVLKLLADKPKSERGAHYTCAVAIADAHGVVGVVEGKCCGVIGNTLKGSHGFGYDPLFIIPKYKRTFAELGPRIKHKMSHRFRALNKAKKIIQKYIVERAAS
ncbi:MAG: RdgB/HAM1 family non-canonical purine NTP pyrophosphatase [Candidatus Omnitrophica bacterium]|nr:RdgB/HAM1 family non-canonical purine NTP pyrophosphatase [Candidatus Omnitrophota bacterium]